MRRIAIVGLCSCAAALAIYSIHKRVTTSTLIKELSRAPAWTLIEERRKMALPKPPPPPTMPGPTDPPIQITKFLAGDARSKAEVSVTIFVLAPKTQRAVYRRDLFLGQPIARTIKVPANSIENIIDRLDERESYASGDYGCINLTGYGIRLTRNDDTLDFELNCGHLFFSAQGHEGSWAISSEEMATDWTTLLEKLRL